MQEIIEKLLVLQDRDRRILRIQEQLARIQPERVMLQSKSDHVQAHAESVKTRVKLVETERKKLELEVESKKQQIERYALQQFETKKNEEYRALAHEIETARAEIVGLEDKQLELMQQTEDLQRQVAAALREAGEITKATQSQLADIASREKNIRDELGSLEANRNQLTAGIDVNALRRYDRLLRSKGDNVVVGIQHGVCGGCHMKFPVHLMIACQAGKELVGCPNCGRILYYTRDMDLIVAE